MNLSNQVKIVRRHLLRWELLLSGGEQRQVAETQVRDSGRVQDHSVGNREGSFGAALLASFHTQRFAPRIALPFASEDDTPQERAEQAIYKWLAQWNGSPAPFLWKTSADVTLDKVRRCKELTRTED